MTNVVAREPNLVNPWAPHRVRMYLGAALFTGLVFVGMTVGGVGVGLIEPTFTSDVIANLLFGIPAILIPLVLLWDAPGEHRMREEKAAELTLFYLPYTAFSQICYELVFLIGHPLGVVDPPHRPGREVAVVAVRARRHPLRQRQPVDLRARGGGGGEHRYRRDHHVDSPCPAITSDREADPVAVGGLRLYRDIDEQHRRLLHLGGGSGVQRYRAGRVRSVVQVHRREHPPLHRDARNGAVRHPHSDRFLDPYGGRFGFRLLTSARQPPAQPYREGDRQADQ